MRAFTKKGVGDLLKVTFLRHLVPSKMLHAVLASEYHCGMADCIYCSGSTLFVDHQDIAHIGTLVSNRTHGIRPQGPALSLLFCRAYASSICMDH